MALFGPCGSPKWRSRVALWSVFYRQGSLPSQEIKSHTACTGHVTWCGNISLCFLPMWVSLFCLSMYVICHPAVVSVPCDEGMGSSHQQEGCVPDNCPCWLPGGIPVLGIDAHYWGWGHLIPSLCQESSFCPGLGCFVSLVTLMHRCSGERCSDFYSRCWATDATCWITGCREVTVPRMPGF